MIVNLIFIPVAVIMCYINGAATVAAFFAALFLHECAHSIVASALGIRVHSLQLMPFGCTAHIESLAVVNRGKEIAMAAAGPAINILAAAAVYLSMHFIKETDFLQMFFKSNVMLAAMNLLPALPLDGGRILATVLSFSMTSVKANRLTSILGICVAAVMLGTGAYMAAMAKFNPTLLLMGGFMLYGSILHYRNAAYVFMKNTMVKREEIYKRAAVDVKSLAVHKKRTLGEVLTNLDSRRYNTVYVLDDDMSVMKQMGEADLMKGVISEGTGSEIQKIIK